jgi:hypothetical protein
VPAEGILVNGYSTVEEEVTVVTIVRTGGEWYFYWYFYWAGHSQARRPLFIGSPVFCKGDQDQHMRLCPEGWGAVGIMLPSRGARLLHHSLE